MVLLEGTMGRQSPSQSASLHLPAQLALGEPHQIAPRFTTIPLKEFIPMESVEPRESNLALGLNQAARMIFIGIQPPKAAQPGMLTSTWLIIQETALSTPMPTWLI